MRCVSDRIDSPFCRMAEERGYEFCLSRILGRMSRSIEGGDLAEFLVVSQVDYRFLEFFLTRDGIVFLNLVGDQLLILSIVLASGALVEYSPIGTMSRSMPFGLKIVTAFTFLLTSQSGQIWYEPYSLGSITIGICVLQKSRPWRGPSFARFNGCAH